MKIKIFLNNNSDVSVIIDTLINVIFIIINLQIYFSEIDEKIKCNLVEKMVKKSKWIF